MYIPKEDNTDEISDDDSPRVDSIPENTDIFSPGGKADPYRVYRIVKQALLVVTTVGYVSSIIYLVIMMSSKWNIPIRPMFFLNVSVCACRCIRIKYY